MAQGSSVEIPEPKISKFVFGDTRFAWAWFILRTYAGWVWLTAAWSKFQSASWLGYDAGAALEGFVRAALQKTAGPHPDISSWYAAFLGGPVLNHSVLFSYLVVYGEFLVGLWLIVGSFTGIAAAIGIFLNMNYLLAGSVSLNPELLVIELLLVLAWRNAGWWGLDRILLPGLGVPWKPGYLFEEKEREQKSA